MVQSDLIAAAALIISVLSFLLQSRHASQQKRIEAELRVKQTNRELVTLGFSHPELFKVIDDQSADRRLERAYLQLWLNFYEQIFLDGRRGAYSKAFHEGLKQDMRAFFSQKNMQRHWQENKIYYQTPFQKFGNLLLPPPPNEETGA